MVQVSNLGFSCNVSFLIWCSVWSLTYHVRTKSSGSGCINGRSYSCSFFTTQTYHQCHGRLLQGLSSVPNWRTLFPVALSEPDLRFLLSMFYLGRVMVVLYCFWAIATWFEQTVLLLEVCSLLGITMQFCKNQSLLLKWQRHLWLRVEEDTRESLAFV